MKKIANAPCKQCTLPSKIIENVSKYFKGAALEIFKTQMKLATVSKKGRRYSSLQRRFCLGLYFHSPRAYRFMSKIFTLPTTRMLRYWLNKIYMEVGWNESVFAFLKEKTSAMKDEEKLCGITFDAVSIKSSIHYDKSYDKFIGFEDCGQYFKGEKPAQYAMVFMAKGLCKKWKQVLGYFLYNKSIPADILKTMIHDCIVKLISCGLHPKFVVCDQDASNRSAFSKLNVSIETPYVEVKDEKIFFFYDTPHLLKSTRNNFTKYDIQIGNDVASWRHIVNFYASDKMHPIRIAPKLTDSHIDSNSFEKMKVKYATQILSRTVASGLYTYAALGGLPKEATGTATFVYKINELFDVFNSSVRYHYRKRKCAVDGMNDNLQFLNDMKLWLSSWKVIGTNRQIPSIKGWLLNIASLQALWEDVSSKYKLEYLLTRRINQDCLENFFCCIRKAGGNNYTPNVLQLKSGMKNLVCNNILSDSYNGNCSDDHTPLISFLHKFDNDTCNDSQPSTILSEFSKIGTRDTCNTNYSESSNSNVDKDQMSPLDDADDIEQFLNNFDYNFDSVEDPPCFSVPADDTSTDSLDYQSIAGNSVENQSLSSIQDFIHNFDYNVDFMEDSAPPYHSKKLDPPTNELIEDNIISYISGYCCHRILKIHDCIPCKSILLKTPDDKDETSLREIFLLKKGDGDDVRYLSHPSQKVFDAIKSFEQIFQKKIMSLIHCDGPKQKLYSYISEVCITDLMLCQEVEPILKGSYLNMRLQYYARFFNQTLRMKRKYSTVDLPPAKRCRKVKTITHV